MPESLSQENTDLRDKAREFANNVMLQNASALKEDDGEERLRIREASKEAGFFGMTQPKSFASLMPTAALKL